MGLNMGLEPLPAHLYREILLEGRKQELTLKFVTIQIEDQGLHHQDQSMLPDAHYLENLS